MSNFGNNNTGFFGGSGSGGGGGGTVTGSGTTNILPKWATSTSLSDSQIFDNGTSVGVGTISPTSGFLFDVNTAALVRTYFQVGSFTKGAGQTGSFITNGLIQTATGINLSGVTGATFIKAGLYFTGNTLEFFAGNTELVNFTLTGNTVGSYATFQGNFTISSLAAGTQNEVRITNTINSTIANNVNVNQILIDPIYNQNTFGTGILRGIYYNPTENTLNGSTHNAWENTSGNIVFGNLADANLRTEVALLDLTGKVLRQSTETTFNLYQGSSVTPIGIEIDFAGEKYVFGNNIASKAALDIRTDEVQFYFNTERNGLYLDFGNLIYRFGQLDDGTLTDAHHQVIGDSGDEQAFFKYGSNNLLYEFNATNKTFKYGDFGAIYGTSSIELDSNNQTILIKGNQGAGYTEFEANELRLTGANLEQDGPGGGGRKYLIIRLNNATYTIECTEI